MQELQKKYSNNKKVILIKKAISDNLGEEELMISDSHTLSSMSKEWINSIKSSDMFFVSTQAFSWQKSAKVQVTTLNQLIKKYGRPVFCKIDVEGYEYKILKGLSEPIRVISFEFTPTQEFILLAINIVEHLASIGEVKFNYSFGESISTSTVVGLSLSMVALGLVIETFGISSEFTGVHSATGRDVVYWISFGLSLFFSRFFTIHFSIAFSQRSNWGSSWALAGGGP